MTRKHSPLANTCKTHYELLGVHRCASIDELKEARRTLAFTHHPDHGGSGMAEINVAFDVLSNVAKHRLYRAGLCSTMQDCAACKSMGYRAKQKGFTGVVHTICAECNGVGMVLKQKGK